MAPLRPAGRFLRTKGWRVGTQPMRRRLPPGRSGSLASRPPRSPDPRSDGSVPRPGGFNGVERREAVDRGFPELAQRRCHHVALVVERVRVHAERRVRTVTHVVLAPCDRAVLPDVPASLVEDLALRGQWVIVESVDPGELHREGGGTTLLGEVGRNIGQSRALLLPDAHHDDSHARAKGSFRLAQAGLDGNGDQRPLLEIEYALNLYAGARRRVIRCKRAVVTKPLHEARERRTWNGRRRNERVDAEADLTRGKPDRLGALPGAVCVLKRIVASVPVQVAVG